MSRVALPGRHEHLDLLLRRICLHGEKAEPRGQLVSIVCGTCSRLVGSCVHGLLSCLLTPG